MMAAGEATGRSQTPVLIHDERPQLRVNASRADGAAIPTGALAFNRCLDGFNPRGLIGDRMFCGALRDQASLVGCQQSLNFFDDERKRRFRISRDPDVVASATSTTTATATTARALNAVESNL